MITCAHCGSPVIASRAASAFCCNGCEAAFALVQGSGLSSYYKRRSIDPNAKPLKPAEEAMRTDFSAHVQDGKDGTFTLHLMVEGLHCAACIWLIESLLSREAGVEQARVNMTTRRLVLRWRGEATQGGALVASVLAVGYRLIPYDPARLGGETLKAEKELLRLMAISGFAAANVMLFSVSIWSGGMDETTRTFFHWLSAAIALPAIVWCARPFARSAFTALRAGRSNMDVPITIGVTLASLMSLWQTIAGAEHAYFDSAISLLFFLLIGRYLDSRARGRARSAAEHLLALAAGSITVIDAAGNHALVPPAMVAQGMVVLVAAGERIGVDGRVTEGISDLDASLISGETVPVAARPGAQVFAGMLNLSAPLKLVVEAVGERTLLAEIVRLMEVAEQGRARHVALADRVARYYAPVVHLAALMTFLGWVLFTAISWQTALPYAIAVLIITCPCALALAVPVVQVVASGRLMRAGILLKSPTALERIATVDTVVFDKTGTLTLGYPELCRDGAWNGEDLRLAASLAAASKHPLARALVRAAAAGMVAEGVTETPGAGLEAGAVRLGSRRWCGVADEAAGSAQPGPELWLRHGGNRLVRFSFLDAPRPDAAQVVADLRRRGLGVVLLSGDRAPTVRAVAESLGIDDWSAACTPADKCARLETLAAQGRQVMMVGDGLNDAPALAAAHVSMSPSTAVDVSQIAADVVFQGQRLRPVVETLGVATASGRLVRQNFGLALAYNLVTVPLAMLGHVTPLIAAIAMSTSSLIVIVNALRLARMKVSS